MKWKGLYRIKCPKCKCRDILVEEHIDAFSEYHIVNGEWIHDYDNDEYGDYTFTVYKCSSCHHVWQFNGTMDKYKKGS